MLNASTTSAAWSLCCNEFRGFHKMPIRERMDPEPRGACEEKPPKGCFRSKLLQVMFGGFGSKLHCIIDCSTWRLKMPSFLDALQHGGCIHAGLLITDPCPCFVVRGKHCVRKVCQDEPVNKAMLKFRVLHRSV